MGSIRSSKFYNNPAIGQAFENLAAAFAPPSGADAAGWARANAEREQAARLAELFDYSKSESYDQTRADRMGVLGGLYTPDKSFYAVDRGDETLRRGQDVESGDRRYTADKSALASMYGHDRSYASSTENNVRDNARALQTNEADNARALREREMQEAGELSRFYAAPVKVAQGERAYLPAQTAAATGLPAQINGADKPMSTDEVAALAMQAMPLGDRQQFVRDKFAPTETQVKGRALSSLDNDRLVAMLQGETPLEEAIGPDGRPQFVRRTDAVGMQPAPKSPSVSVTTGAGEGAFDKTLGENQAKLFLDLSSDGVQARDDLALLNRLGDQMKDLPGGMLGGLQSVASRWGIKLGENASNAEAADAIIARLVPAARQGLPGAASDRDVALFKSSLPSLSNTKEGAAIISETLRGLAQAKADRARIATAVVNGDITRAQGMTAIQELPDPFARLRDTADAMGIVPGPFEPRSSAPAGPTTLNGYTIEAID